NGTDMTSDANRFEEERLGLRLTSGCCCIGRRQITHNEVLMPEEQFPPRSLNISELGARVLPSQVCEDFDSRVAVLVADVCLNDNPIDAHTLEHVKQNAVSAVMGRLKARHIARQPILELIECPFGQIARDDVVPASLRVLDGDDQ